MNGLRDRVSGAAAANRLTFVAAVLLLWGVWIVWTLFSIQIRHHTDYVLQARKQQEEDVSLQAPRGSIYDRNGQPLAISVPVESVSVNPMRMSNLRVASEVLANMLHLDQTALYGRLTQARKNRRGFMWVKHRLDPFETEHLKGLNLEWASFHTESQRHYPKLQTAAHVIGTVYKEEEGAAGIEKAFDTSLRGHNGSQKVVMDVKRRGIASHIDSAPMVGTALTLTIDERLQYIAEKELKAQVELKHARYGTAIVMDPYNGEIMALANFPTYDPNKPPPPGESKWARFNLGVSVPFEPGSIYKVVTLSAALETTNLTPESPIATGNGTLSLPGRIVHEAHGGYGTITMQQVLEKSSNIGAILIGARVGREKMYEYSRRFGFGEKTGVGLPAESRGLLRTLDKWGTTSLASISMGQEISTTSVQLARACSVIANGGLLVKPKIVLKRGDITEPTQTPVRVLKPETVMTMRMMMEGVVLRGTGRLTARLDGYTSAGKTGTAQIFENGHYTHLYNASFMGFVPVTNPRFVIVVTLNGTEGNSGMGGAAAAPVFKSIATEAMRLLDIPKDIPEDVVAVRKPVLGGPVEENLPIAGLSERSIMEDDPSLRELLAAQEAEAALPVDDSIPAVPAKGPRVPDFRGKSVRNVVELASAEGIAVTIQGSGVARAQVPAAGRPMNRGEKIRVVFAR
ncbi:MAG: Peptidoglycan glycosyltransferase [Bryobacterales bacterium]|nr:Peptidoglycan glycosyltransferase [Bryobacterales bacterium]